MHTKNKRYVTAALLSIAALLPSCIKNDLPYPQIVQNITSIAAEGQVKTAYIDSVSLEATVYLGEQTDIRNVRFTEFTVSEGGTCQEDLLSGTWDLSKPLIVTITRYQDYNWEIRAVQDIVRYFEVEGEVGASIVDAEARRVVVHVPEGTDLADLRLLRCKLGPEGITTITPALNPGRLDLSYPLRVEVEAYGRTEIWTIYAEISEMVVSTTRVDGWSQVIWAYGSGPADADNGFEYKLKSATEWIKVPDELITRTQGIFSCYIPHLVPLETYQVRTYSGENVGNIMEVTLQGTADIPNGDFEQWHQTSNKMWCPWPLDGTQFWDTGNTGTMTLGANNTVPSENTPTGSGYSAQCNTKFVGIGVIGKLGAGSIFTGRFDRVDGTNGILQFGRPWKLRPTRLKGYYQYKTANINYTSAELKALEGRPDTCVVYVALTDWTAPYEIRTNPKNRNLFDKNADYVIAYGEFSYSGTMSGFAPFEIKLDYRDTSRVPSYLQITCAASKYGDYFTGADGAVLWVDQFYFDWDY